YLLEGTKESVMLIEVDNLSEVMKSMDESNSPLFVAEIERTINAYAQRLKAMIRKYDFSKYVLSLSDNDVEGEISRKFDILDIIRDINLGNKLEVTLSIGVGRGGNSPAENHADAIKAKELALGRGGDQAVIKKGNNFSFFGGNTKELEKRTRVRARVIAHALKDLIYESNKVYIMGHKNPDLDCFGAAIGLSSVVKQLGKPCNIVLNKDTKAIEYYLSKILKSEENKNLIINCDYAKEYIDDETLLVLVDVHSKSYVQDIDLVKKSIKTVIIDHHRKSPDFIQDTLLNYTEVYASSTSELVTEMVQYMLDKPKLTRIQAEGLLAGICMDTKNFFFKTGVRTFEAAAFLRKLGADTIDIKKFFSNDLESYRKKAEIIKTTELENEIAIATCPNDIIDTVTAAQAADQLLNIAGIEASFVLIRINTDVYISGRSLGDINVQVILEMLGGGGHMTIAGAKINNITLEDAKIKLKDEISKYLKEGE
ncbi:MAG: DHH family phosphoesterase, partial [Sarcina sp.]